MNWINNQRPGLRLELFHKIRLKEIIGLDKLNWINNPRPSTWAPTGIVSQNWVEEIIGFDKLMNLRKPPRSETRVEFEEILAFSFGTS